MSEGDPASRRILIISYYFPPAGGAGVQRILKSARYLRDFGWEPTVLTVDDGAYAQYDYTLLDELPGRIRIERTDVWDPYRAYAKFSGTSRDALIRQGSVKNEAPGFKARLARWLRANVLLPDARVGWVPHAVKRGAQLLTENRFDAVLTSGPPHSSHLIGRYLASRFELPWLADFRDPWTDINYYHELPHTSFARSIDRLLERQVLTAATAVTTVSPGWRDLLLAKIPGADTAFHVIENGFDPEDMNVTEPPDDRFVCSHIGSLYASRNPKKLWAVLSKLHKQGEIPDLCIVLAGSVDEAVRQSIREAGLSNVVQYRGYVDHPSATTLMYQSHILLLCIEEFKEESGMITGKLYEYLASGRPVLGIGPPKGDAAALIRGLKAGNMFDRDDEAGIRKALMDSYTTWAIGNELKGASPTHLASYTRRAQTKTLAGLLNNIVDTAPKRTQHAVESRL